MFYIYLMDKEGYCLEEYSTAAQPAVGRIIKSGNDNYYEVKKVAHIVPKVCYTNPSNEDEFERFVCEVERLESDSELLTFIRRKKNY